MKSSLEQLRGRNNSDVTSSDHNEGDDTRYYERPPLQQANRPELSRKRQRIMHACDECRRKKIKCDGRKPCFHCSVYGYACTYDDPSKRGRIISPRQVEAIETRLNRAERLLHILEPGLDLNDLYLNTNSPEKIAAMLRQPTPISDTATTTGDDTIIADTIDDSLLGPVMENSGSLDIDHKGQWNYNGQSSTTIFMQRLQNQFGNLIAPIPTRSRSKFVEQSLNDPATDIGGSHDAIDSFVNYSLPQESRARELCQLAFDAACVCYHFIHSPSFWTSFDQIYATQPDDYGAEERVFLPLLYAVLSVGHLFRSTDQTMNDESAVLQGLQYFRACRALLDLTDCRDLASLQAILFMVLFLQSSASLITCYPYIGIAQRASLRLGLHRKIQGNFDPIQRELRKRIFWTVYGMDVYVSTRLGLPIAIHAEDIDQEYPLEVDDEFITSVGIVPMPPGRVSGMIAVNAHSRLLDIIVQVVKHIYPVELAKRQGQPDNTYMISYSKIQEIEASLQQWMHDLPSALQSRDGNHPVSSIWEPMSQLLRLAHAHVRWMLYRPFLQFVSQGFRAEGLDKRLYMCADACVSASRNIIDITKDMQGKGLLSGAHWFPMHATYFATLTLIYPILEQKQGPTLKVKVIESAFEGMNVLEALAKNGLAIERCPRLPSLFKYLPEKLYSPNHQVGSADIRKAAGVPSQRYSASTNPQYTPLQTPASSNPNSVVDQPNTQQEVAHPQQPSTNQQDSDMMRMFFPPELVAAQADNFDDIFTHFGMDMFYANDDS